MNNTLLTGQDREDYIKAHFTPETSVPEELMIEDEVDDERQELIDVISDYTNYITEESEYDEFIELLDYEGMSTSQEFEDRFEAEICQGCDLMDWVEEMIEGGEYLKDVPDFIKNHIDYQSIWDCELRFDYSVIEYNNRTYLFHN